MTDEGQWASSFAKSQSTLDTLADEALAEHGAGLTDLEREALHGWRRYTASLWRGYTAELGVPAGAPETLPWRSEEEPEPVSLRQLHRWAQAARRSRWPLPSGRESVFELLCVVRLLALNRERAEQARGAGDATRPPCPSVRPKPSKICQAAYVKAHRASHACLLPNA